MPKKSFVIIALLALVAVTSTAAEVQKSDFEVKTTRALVNL